MIWIPAFVFLIGGLQRIRKVMKKLHDYTMVEESFLLYAACAALAIIGEIPGIILGFLGDDYQSKAGYAWCIIGENVLIFAYQMLLVIILFNLIRRAVQSKQRSKTDENPLE